jgi:hypothetical protein
MFPPFPNLAGGVFPRADGVVPGSSTTATHMQTTAFLQCEMWHLLCRGSPPIHLRIQGHHPIICHLQFGSRLGPVDALSLRQLFGTLVVYMPLNGQR